MKGTIVCGAAESESGRHAVRLAIELSERFDARLVLVHVAPGVEAVDGEEGLTASYGRRGAERVLQQLATEFGLEASQRRWAVGDPASSLATLAAEEAADVIVLGARSRGFLRRALTAGLALDLQGKTDIPVVIAPPRAQRHANGQLEANVTVPSG